MTPATGTETRGLGERVRGIGSFVLGIFTRNLAAKVAAMLLALLVWVTIRQDLTKPYTDPQTYVAVNLDPGLMEVGHHPTYVKVEFEGPASQIDAIQRKERAEIRLRVRQSDLGDQTQANVVFGLDRGNIQHSYGDEVKIVQMTPTTITLHVAKRGERTVPVNPPRVIAVPEWKGSVDVITKEVHLTGPEPELAGIASITPDPIRAKVALEGVTGDQKSTRSVVGLPESYAKRQITIANGHQIEYQVVFVRSQVSKDIRVPYRVQTTKQGWPVKLVPNEFPPTVQKDAEGDFTIQLTFVGSESDLSDLQKAIEKGEVYAYVEADDFGPYLKKDTTGHGSVGPIRMHWPMSFWGGRVTFQQPPASQIIVEVQKQNS